MTIEERMSAINVVLGTMPTLLSALLLEALQAPADAVDQPAFAGAFTDLAHSLGVMGAEIHNELFMDDPDLDGPDGDPVVGGIREMFRLLKAVSRSVDVALVGDGFWGAYVVVTDAVAEAHTIWVRR